MKKTFKTMLAIVAGALCIAGCAKEETIEAIDNGPKLVTLTAFQEGGDATKASIDAEDSKKIDWTTDDQINYFGAATGEYMTLTSGAGTTSGEFQGEVTTGTSNYVLYPYQSTATCAEGVITAEVPMTQYAVAGSFDPAAALMVGVVNGSRVEFKNVMSYIKVTIPSDLTNCKQVAIKAKDAWTTVAGKVNISAADATWAETTAKEGQAFVRLVPQDGDDYLTAGASYYVAILPQDMTTGFELIFNDNDVIKVKQSSSSSVVFSRNTTKKLGAITSFTYTVGTVTAGTMTLADRNIGAATTESTDYGDYFAWAALRPAYSNKTTPTWYKDGGFTLANTPYYNGSAYTKYPDAEDNLDATDDIASMLWGGNWHIPTSAEWSANTNDTNVKALPLGGCYDSLDDGTILRHVGESSAYWASDTQAHNEYADDGHQANYYFNQTTPFPMSYVVAEGRLVGRNVRPVLTASAPAADPNLLAGEFSVSATKKVKFTKGNLYWTGSAYQFEADQTNYPEAWNTSHIGHFYWSQTAAVAYEQTYSDGSRGTDDKLFCGEDNKLTVSGTSDLYVLSAEEWHYLTGLYNDFSYTDNRSDAYRFANARVNGVAGLLIFPDGYNGTVSGDGIATVNVDDVQKPSASIDPTTWSTMEAAGVVFLPAAGCRSGQNVDNSGNNGYYWSSTLIDKDNAYMLFDYYGIVDCPKSQDRQRGCSIRLVKTVE